MTTPYAPPSVPPPPPRRRAGRLAIVLGTLVVLVVLGLLAARLVDGVRDVTAPAGSARAQERDAARAAVDDAALVRATGVALAQLRTTPGVVLRHDPGATVDCLDSCSQAELEVSGAAAEAGPLAREALLARLRGEGYRDAVGDGVGCPALDPARPCRLRAPDGASLQLSVAADDADYVLRVDGGT